MAGLRSSMPTHRIDAGPFLDRAFDAVFSVFVFLTIFLPGGSVYGFNFKYPIYLCLLPLGAVVLFRRRLATPSHLVLLCVVPVLLAGWIVVGLVRDFTLSGVVRQYTDILLTLLLCWLFVLYSAGLPARRLRFIRLVLNAATATAVLKLVLIGYAVLRGIPVVQMVVWLDDVFGVDLMTMDLGALFGRVQFVSDALIPVCIFTVLRYRDRLGIGTVRASLTMLVLLVSLIFSFSRFFFGFAALAFLLGLLLAKRDRFQAVLASVLGVAVLAALPVLVSLYQLRFASAGTAQSDSERTGQIPPLIALFLRAPLLGNGLGSYSTALLRNTTEAGRYGYEQQLLALVAQVGLLGVSLLAGLALYYYRNLWWMGALRLRDRLAIATLLLAWIAVGLTNPLLFHPVAGILYATLAAFAGLDGDTPHRTRGSRSRLGLQLQSWHQTAGN